MPRFRIDQLLPLAGPAETDGRWYLEAESAVRDLQALVQGDEVLVHASGPSFLVVGALALQEKLTPPDWSDLEGGIMPYPSPGWSIQHVQSGRQDRRIFLEAPMASGTSKSFEGGEPIVFHRRLQALNDAPAAIEISQKLTHSLDIYYLAERKAYCRIDDRGDIQEVVRVIEGPRAGDRPRMRAVTVLRKDLEEFMAVTATCLVLRFDFTRAPANFTGWGDDHQRFRREFTHVAYHGGSNAVASYVNGALVLPATRSVSDMIREWRERDDPQSRKYAQFKIVDWRNKQHLETSCGPEHLTNYFEKKSDLPYELSPAFFRAEVLLKYKNDPEKYEVERRSISCRGAWHLETYDINEEGQVHTYVGYLARLPYEEQLYWQSFNEWPAGPISKRSFQTDFMGSWDTEYDPLEALKRHVRDLDECGAPWWLPRGETLLQAACYPATDSVKEWADDILALDQLLVEGFSQTKLHEHARNAGVVIDPKWRALKVLQAIVETVLGAEEARATISGLFELHELRSIVKGHATGGKGKQAVVEARTKFGTLRAHFRYLAARCDIAIRAVRKELTA